jgi:hypothetical protein
MDPMVSKPFRIYGLQVEDIPTGNLRLGKPAYKGLEGKMEDLRY